MQSHRHTTADPLGSVAGVVSTLLLLTSIAPLPSAAQAPGDDDISGTYSSDPDEVDVPPSIPVSPSPSSGEEGDVRLVDRIDVNGYATGALQVFCNGAWGAVCTASFDNADALVACRQLGFATGIVLPDRSGSPYGEAQVSPEARIPFALENLGCTGSEARVLDCPPADVDVYYRGFPDYYGAPYEGNDGECDADGPGNTFAYVACGGISEVGEGAVRLSGSTASADGSAQYGRLEVFHRGGWGTVCDVVALRGPAGARGPEGPRFTQPSADVVCRQLGFPEGFQIQAPEIDEASVALTERVPIVVGGVACRGGEAALPDCLTQELGRVGSQCRHSADVHVVCYSPDADMDGRLRLADSTAGQVFEYGRLEVFLHGFWSNVCRAKSFTPDAAQVACRELGYDGGAVPLFTRPYAIPDAEVGGSARVDVQLFDQVLFEDIPVALAAVDCDGDEASLLDCQRNDRLVGTCNNKTTSTVLACGNTAPGCDKGPGSEEGAVRLRGGFGTLCDPVHFGFIEVRHNGEWGAICREERRVARGEDTLVADVVCRQLGFPHGTLIDPVTPGIPTTSDYDDDYEYFYFPRGVGEEAEEPIGRVWLSAAECRGTEDRLFDCRLGEGSARFLPDGARCDRLTSFPQVRLHVACRQFPVVQALEAVSTPGAEEGDLRLVNETSNANWVTGRLEVFFEGAWSQVCAGLFGGADADVACRQLGFGAGTVVGQDLSVVEKSELRSTPLFAEVALTTPGCAGTEARLLDCAGDPALDSNALPGQRFTLPRERLCRSALEPGLVLGCVASPETGPEAALRLTDRTEGPTPGLVSGALEVFHAGAWGSLCRSRFSLDVVNPRAAGRIACRELGFATGSLAVVADSAAEAVLPPWLSGVQCTGSEAAFSECRQSAFGDTSTCGPSFRLFCAAAGIEAGQVRLVGGNADPGGRWQYGGLEVLVASFWSSLSTDKSIDDFDRYEAQVACRSLGFATGVEPIIPRNSSLPVPVPADRPVTDDRFGITCTGTEAALTDCSIDRRVEPAVRDGGRFTGRLRAETGTVSLVCTNPSGTPCESAGSVDASPQEGDVRLVPLQRTAEPTTPCDPVHFGGVEIYHDGRWGRICYNFAGPAEFTLDAQVVCRQLGFPFGSAIVADETGPAPAAGDDVLVWATQVVCTGKEDRLLDCNFPQEFGAIGQPGAFYYNSDYVNDDGGDGIRPVFCGTGDSLWFSVMCRDFELVGVP